MIAIHDEPRRPADEQYGYAFGCDGLVKIKDAAATLSVDVSTVYRLIQKGRLRKGRIGPTSRICKRSLTEFMNSIES